MRRDRYQPASRSTRVVGLFGALVLSGTTVACGAEQGAGEDGQDGPELLASTEAPSTLTFGSVTANGTGCPAGTWKGVVSEDGKHYSIKFEAFDPRVDREKAIAIEDCQLGISLNTPEDSSVALESVKLGGWVSLSRGTSASVQTSAYFQGDPTKAAETKKEYTGSRLSRLGTIEYAEDARVWSPCGKERKLNLRTTVRVKGDQQHRGLVRIDELEDLKFAIKKCGDDGKPDEGGEKPDEGGEKPDADGPAILSVKANGTGCPPDSSKVTIRPDGLGARIDYTSFVAEVDENTSVTVKNCQLAIALANMDKFQYQVSSTIDGYATLEAGQSAKFVQKLYNQGSPTTGHEVTSELTGPFDDTFKMDTLVPDQLTTCGTARNVNLDTVVRLQNAPEKKDGIVDLAGTILANVGVAHGQVITVTATPCK